MVREEAAEALWTLAQVRFCENRSPNDEHQNHSKIQAVFVRGSWIFLAFNKMLFIYLNGEDKDGIVS